MALFGFLKKDVKQSGGCGTCAHCDWDDYEHIWMCWNPDGEHYEQNVDVFDRCELYEERGADEWK